VKCKVRQGFALMLSRKVPGIEDSAVKEAGKFLKGVYDEVFKICRWGIAMKDQSWKRL
jgi:hypothetical protein